MEDREDEDDFFKIFLYNFKKKYIFKIYFLKLFLFQFDLHPPYLPYLPSIV